jgi:hypothetical protein
MNFLDSQQPGVRLPVSEYFFGNLWKFLQLPLGFTIHLPRLVFSSSFSLLRKWVRLFAAPVATLQTDPPEAFGPVPPCYGLVEVGGDRQGTTVQHVASLSPTEPHTCLPHPHFSLSVVRETLTVRVDASFVSDHPQLALNITQQYHIPPYSPLGTSRDG